MSSSFLSDLRVLRWCVWERDDARKVPDEGGGAPRGESGAAFLHPPLRRGPVFPDSGVLLLVFPPAGAAVPGDGVRGLLFVEGVTRRERFLCAPSPAVLDAAGDGKAAVRRPPLVLVRLPETLRSGVLHESPPPPPPQTEPSRCPVLDLVSWREDQSCETAHLDQTRTSFRRIRRSKHF